MGVYGLVKGLVKLDAGGLYRTQRSGVDMVAQIQRFIEAGIAADAIVLFSISTAQRVLLHRQAPA